MTQPQQHRDAGALRAQLSQWAEMGSLKRILVSHGEPIDANPQRTPRDLGRLPRMTRRPLPAEHCMGDPQSVVALSRLPIIGRKRGQLASPVDGRYGALNPDDLRPAIATLVRDVDLEGVKYVLGIPEGGCIPAYAFAVETGLRVILASIWRPNVPAVVSFLEEHDPPAIAGKHCLGLTAGDRVVVVEDEVTSGRTIVNCVRALRTAGIRCDQVATVYAADDPAMRARVAAEGIALHFAWSFQLDANENVHCR